MPTIPDVVIIHARCSANRQGFGIRMEKMAQGVWSGDWSFPLTDRRARSERYGERRIDGHFQFAPSYPGCTGCGAASILMCGCGGISCWNGVDRIATCAWCGNRAELSGQITSLTTGSDL